MMMIELICFKKKYQELSTVTMEMKLNSRKEQSEPLENTTNICAIWLNVYFLMHILVRTISTWSITQKCMHNNKSLSHSAVSQIIIIWDTKRSRQKLI